MGWGGEVKMELVAKTYCGKMRVLHIGVLPLK
jgi:hypothetical protein